VVKLIKYTYKVHIIFIMCKYDEIVMVELTSPPEYSYLVVKKPQAYSSHSKIKSHVLIQDEH
jgi:hypothetical protein